MKERNERNEEKCKREEGKRKEREKGKRVKNG
jgi:hypothetical protein